MSMETKFDAIELARLANPEIGDGRRIASAGSSRQKPVTDRDQVGQTAVLRAFRDLAKGS